MKSIPLLVLIAVGLGACGGDGGNSLPTPLVQPQISPTLPKTADAMAMSQVAHASSSQCGGDGAQSAVTYDDAGHALIMWCEKVANVYRLNATWLPSLQTVTVAREISPANISWSVESVGGARFVIVHNDGAGINMIAQTLDFSGPVPQTGARRALPPSTPGTLVKDAAGALHFMVSSQVRPFPVISLEGGLSFDIAAPQGVNFHYQLESQWVTSRSVSPRALWGVVGYLNSSDVLPDPYAVDVYVADVDLSSTVPPTLVKISQAPFLRGTAGTAATGSTSCYGYLMTRYLSTGAGKWATAWRQADPVAKKCALYVDGVRLSDTSNGIGDFELTHDGDALIAVWEISKSPGPRIVWSRRDPVTQQWSSPVSIAPAFDSDLLYQGSARFGSNSNGTLAVAWQPYYGDGKTNGYMPGPTKVVSKFVHGQWSHYTPSIAGDIQSVSVNTDGQGVAVIHCNSEYGCIPSVAAVSF